jgi:hypothetical protein
VPCPATLILLPTRTKFLTEIEEPIWQKCKQLIALPNLPNERMEMALPAKDTSRTDKAFNDPNTNMPMTETDEPMRMKFLKLKELPQPQKPNTDRFLPTRDV